ncbi:uncharacterized protein K460DRAFT_403252 [Cucurbitaria berberidis CBS 394.84]|uniref:Uncharacterized protein n=1 Tax=Cucurbitaria berberidis CBS 394.84 TaxID=1168544 RepID=A0A9P4GMA5_9PLEO|nr:uncharacterized protein K460DRAFT_403252 [Cucurbitaria berberidis CBS 394.84]KAF1847936.1 hypothetical protein K460DRAFT_403252 [Cucurbitaria berberidis CBS 394.84]
MESPQNAQDAFREEPATQPPEVEGKELEHNVEDHQKRTDIEALKHDLKNKVKPDIRDNVKEGGKNSPDQTHEQTVENEKQLEATLGDDESVGELGDAEGGAELQHGRNQRSPETGNDVGNVQIPSPGQDEHRTSLEDLLKWPPSRVWHSPGPAGGEQILLPPSKTSSTIKLGTSEMEQLPLGHSLEQLMLQPENVALPKRKKKQAKDTDFGDWGLVASKAKDKHVDDWGFGAWGATSKSKTRKKGKKIEKQMPPLPPPIAPEVEAYRANVNRLATNFSHFENVAAGKTRHHWSPRIVVHNRVEPAHPEVIAIQEPWKERQSAPHYQEFYDTLRNVPVGCVQRTILVEDLTPSLIDLLGASFQIPPHVFEEHLEGGGYRTTPENRDNANTWHTRSSAQGYSSITWYRPVLPLFPITSRFRARLVRDRKPSLRCVYDGCERRHDIRLQTTANIWRRSLELCPEPGVYHKGSETEFPVGWEERATIWTRDIDGCRFVILLLDPLPVTVVSESTGGAQTQHQHRPPVLVSLLRRPEVLMTKARTSRAKEEPQSSNVQDWIAQASHYSVDPDSHRPESSPLPPPPETMPVQLRPLPITLSAAGLPPLPPPPPPPGIALIPVRRNQSRTTGAKIKIQEADFSPAALRRRATKPDMELPSPSSGPEDVGTSNLRNRKRSISDSRNPRPPSVEVSRPPLPLVDEESIVTETHGPFVPFHPIKARQSSSARIGNVFTTLHTRAYLKSLQVPTSTLEEFEYFLQRPSKGKETAHDPFRALFRVIHDDTHSLVDIIRISQQRIREGTMDEDLMQKRVTFWRGLLHRLNFSLAEVDQRLRAFVHFTYDSETHPFTFDQRTELPSEKLAKETKQTLRSCIDLLDRSSNSLLAEMQIVDSRRSIAEAESVSKLTELAFVFIPLSFVASLFSMQIHELDGGVSLYVFVMVAIGFVLVAYAGRLSIRSSRLIEYKSKVLLQIRDKSQIQYNQPIPTHTFLAWVGKAMGGIAIKSMKSFIAVFAPLMLVLAILAAILSPIILLWLRNISKGFTAVITVLLLLLDVMLVYPVVVTASGTFELNPRTMIREIQRNREMKRKRKNKTKKRRKEKVGIDPESLDVESSDESDKDYV